MKKEQVGVRGFPRVEYFRQVHSWLLGFGVSCRQVSGKSSRKNRIDMTTEPEVSRESRGPTLGIAEAMCEDLTGGRLPSHLQ